MIKAENLKDILTHLNFTQENNIYKQEYSTGASITVDFNKNKIIYFPLDESFSNGEYPTKEKTSKGFVIHRDTTLNFSADENFVCLVCVHLLLKKGYEAKHIVFEPSFKVGHVNKPSYGDILVFDKEYNPLVLIENKTFGKEFSNEWNNMQKDGGQLFSYLGPLVNTLGFCENIVLFAADFEKNLITKSHIITLKDNEKRIADLENPKTFLNAQGKYFDVWNETYGKSFETKGLFEEDIEPYTIGKEKYTIKDLKELSHAEIKPIYHEFATILRNHAITDFEHSFYILIDLFLCKITDERNNPNDLQFYYKGITRDTPKEYCARLLKLYKLGKKQLFGIDVINKEEKDIEQVFTDTSRSLKNGLFDGIKKLFDEIKFYNIKKFNFIDVENKEEFELNFQILIKVTALIQDINLSNSETNHFFGDLFEGLLSKNVHQTEGQFFTPLPIVNFIIKSLPDFPNAENIKVLDYACGAGHFLTEFIKEYSNISVYGIEKSQPLSQVAKIATIINGAKNSHVAFSDALSDLNTKEVRFQGFEKESFNCILANPPYSVKGYLSNLTEKDRKEYELINAINEKSFETNKAIECFFIERTKQFLKTNALMALVLPSSILSNSNICKKAREILFAHFNILSIVELGSRTFGSTGTNTIILFAQKVGKNAEGLVNTFLAKKDYTQYVNYNAIDAYIKKQNYNKEDYFSFMQEDKYCETLIKNEVFADYKKSFKPKPLNQTVQTQLFKKSQLYNSSYKQNSTEYKDAFKQYLKSEEYKDFEQAEYNKQFVEYAKKIECDKLTTFIQIENNEVAILKSPQDKQAIQFLGYDWSNRKGDEGIKYLTTKQITEESTKTEEKDDKDTEVVNAINSIKYINTPLYNPNDNCDNTKFAFAIKKHLTKQCKRVSFEEEIKTNEKLNEEFSNPMSNLLSYENLSNLIDFSRTSFDKVIKTNVTKTVKIESKWKLKELDTLLLKIEGNITKIPQNEILESGLYPVVTQESEKEISGYTNNPNVINDLPLILFGDHSCSFKYIDYPFIRGADGTQLIKTNQKELITKYLYFYLQNLKIYNSEKYERHFKYLKSEQIPLPPIETQKQIVTECQKIDDEYNNAQKQIEQAKAEIENIMANVTGEMKKLGDVCEKIRDGSHNPPKPSQESNFKMLSAINIFDNKLHTDSNFRFINEMSYESENKRQNVRFGDVLLTIVGTVGRSCVFEIDEKITFQRSVAIMTPNKDLIDSKYLMYVLENMNKYLNEIAHGSTQKGVYLNQLQEVLIPVPPIHEQEKVVSLIAEKEKLIQDAKSIIASCPEQKKQVLKEFL